MSQKLSQKNRPDCANSNKRFCFSGPFLLKPRRSEVSLRSRQLGKVDKNPGKRAQVRQDPTFPNDLWLPFKVSQKLGQKNRPDCASSNKRFPFPGPFLLKPRRSQVSLGSRQLEKSPNIQENKRKCVKIFLFLSHPRLPFKVSQKLGQKNRPDCANSNRRFSFPRPFLLKPRRSQVSLGSRLLAKVAKYPGKRAQVRQDTTFPQPSSAPF